MTRDGDDAALDATTMGPSAMRTREPPRATVRIVFTGARPVSEQHALRQGTTPIGRLVDAVMGIRVEGDPRTSREHAAFVVDGGGVRVVNKSQHGTFRNGARIDDGDGGALLVDGDVVQVGDTFAVFRLVPADVVDAVNKSIVGVSPAAARLRSTV